VTASRLAADLLLWTTAEFAFLELPDELVGSSSAMPQKRNPFLLEHVKGRSARAAGAFVAAATAMHATPFANSVAVGTEGCAGAVEALEAAADCAALLRLVVVGARPQPGAMLARATAGHTTATARAERLVLEDGLSFREAHRLVGQLLTDAETDRRSSGTPVVPQERRNGGEGADRRSSLTPVVPQERRNGGEGADRRSSLTPVVRQERRSVADGLDPGSVARAARFGGGPGAPPALDDLRRRRAALAADRAERARRWRRADTDLAAAVAAVIGATGAPPPAPAHAVAGSPA
ncbi:MAG TPA: lyase family protein, partial [Acidimicrobiia bacterium]|nr:lyase family protein [Acidimicrobiia bacterium]